MLGYAIANPTYALLVIDGVFSAEGEALQFH